MAWKNNFNNNPLIYEFINDDGCIIRVRKGQKGNLNTDILVTLFDSKVKDQKEKNIKHIYWVVDVLIKKEHNPVAMNNFISYFVNMWSALETFKSNHKENIEKWIAKYLLDINLSDYKELDGYGFLSMQTLHRILLLLSGNEKSAGENTFMFKTIITRIANNDPDIYDVVAWADSNKADIKWKNRR